MCVHICVFSNHIVVVAAIFLDKMILDGGWNADQTDIMGSACIPCFTNERVNKGKQWTQAETIDKTKSLDTEKNIR